MLVDDLYQNPTNILVATDNKEHTYRTVSMLYLAMHGARNSLPIYLLDVDGSSENLLTPSRSLSLAEVTKLDLHNPEKTFVILATTMSQEHLKILRRQFGLIDTITQQQLTQELGTTPYNHINYSVALYDKHRRAFGTGAKVLLVNCIENVYDLGNYFTSIQQMEQYDFSGFLIKGIANTNQFKTLAMRSLVATLPIMSLQPTLVTDINPSPKKLLVCYSAIMIRFMAIENIKYFFKMQDPELFEKVEFMNLAELDLSHVKKLVNESFAFICLDMGQEHSILMPEAMYGKNIILGFGGSFDNETDLTNNIVDLSSECDYRDIADKLVYYAREYATNLAQDPNYIHPIAQAAHLHASMNYSSNKLITTIHLLCRKLGVTL